MNRDQTVQEIIEALTRCQRVRTASPAWRKIGLSHSQVGMLYMILHHKDANVKKISEQLGVTKSAITQLLEPMVNKGFIERKTDSIDRRVVRFSLSDKGKDALKEINKHKFANLRSAINTLSEQEIDDLSKIHRKINDNLDKKVSEV
jgi:DNA-binding MarR family transcriptional regulator